MNGFDRFFEITERQSTVAAEVRGGLVTFVTMAYIVILNPIILSSAADVEGNSSDFAQVAAVTALTAGVMTMLFGLVARLPFAFAAGLGINSFLAVDRVGQVTWPEAMGLVVINGLIIVLLAATGLRRRMIFNAVPDPAQARDHGRHRPVHRLHRASSTPGSSRSTGTGLPARRARHGEAARSPPCRRSSSCSRCC